MILLSGEYADTLVPRLEQLMPVGRYEQAETDELLRASVLVTRGKLRVDREIMARMPGLRLVIKAGAGVDTIDVGAAAERGVEVHATGGSEESVADLALALTMSCLRNVVAFDGAVRRLDWASKSRFVGTTIASRRIGIIGFGRIGRSYARMTRALGAEVRFWDRTPDRREKAACAAQIGADKVATIHDLIAASDVISIHVPYSSETAGLIGSREIGLMSPGTVLVNTSRAGVVDRDALAESLASNRLAAAGLDVHYLEGKAEHDAIYDLQNVVLTPHVGAQSIQAQQAISDRIVDIVRSGAAQAMQVAS